MRMKTEKIGSKIEASVVLPVYNAEKYLDEAVQSVLNQTFRDFEVIIIDDASKDSSWPIIQKYAASDSRIRAYKNEKNLKLSLTLNKGIGLASGKYIIRVDADDISLPDRFQKQIDYMEQNLQVGVSGGAMKMINGEGEPIGERKYSLTDKDLRKRIFMFSPFSHPTLIIRKAILEKSGLFDHSFNPAEDYELYFRLGLYSKFGNLPDYIIKYRVLSNSMTGSRLKDMELKTIEVRKKYYKEYKAGVLDKLYNNLHRLSVGLIPSTFKINLFTKLRSLFK